MLKDGTYAAWFKTPLGQGTGIAHVTDGKICGRDGVMTYSGTCAVDGDRFTATIVTKKHAEGQTVFGSDDELKLTLEGTCSGKIARFIGTAEQFPGVALKEHSFSASNRRLRHSRARRRQSSIRANCRSCRSAPVDYSASCPACPKAAAHLGNRIKIGPSTR